MSDEMQILRAFIDVSGYEIKATYEEVKVSQDGTNWYTEDRVVYTVVKKESKK